MTQKKFILMVCYRGIYKDLLALKTLLLLADWAALCDSCQKSFTKKSKSVDVDNLPLEILADEINDDELLDCAKEIMQIEKQGKPKKRLRPGIIRSVWFNVIILNQKNTTVN